MENDQNMIRLILFDIDGTLLDSFEANLEFYQRLMRKFGYREPTRGEFTKYFHLPLREGIQAITEIDSKEKIEEMFNEGQRRDFYYDTNLLKVPDGVEDVVKTLSKNYVLGIVTSRIRQNVFEAPRLAKLKGYFRIVVAYEDTEEHKPHPAPLILASEHAGIPVSESVYIGDAETDMKSAIAAKMKFILYGKENLIGADAHINDFRELPKVIRGL